jgi:ATP-dependent RNA helicase DDX55/SPB4
MVSYVEFLQVKNVPAAARSLGGLDAAATITEHVRQQALDDRDVMEKAQRAFVSFIRAYREHHCSYIFRIAQLDIGRLAMGLGLLFLPFMSEYNGKHIDFTPVDVAPSVRIRPPPSLPSPPPPPQHFVVAL